jgi:formate hydrogenlyase subunit 6/NADH:ubiquinone oxidoreductase subunit I
METQGSLETIPIYVMGNRYDVPAGLTIMKALEYAGYKLTRGCGCRGGVCGACVTIYRKKDEYRWQVGLACQTVVEKDIFLVQLPYVPAHKAAYDIRSFNLSEQSVTALYPELLCCMGCNTCTRSCPMDLEVMNYVSAAITGDWETVTKLSIECVMCGICAARCPAELAPFNIAMLVRRMVGKQKHQTSPDVEQRLKDISDGTYDLELANLKKMDKAQLEVLFRDFQASKGEAVRS